MANVVILIITHKPSPSVSEINSLLQCQRVLGKYPIVLICPEGMKVDRYRHFVPGIKIDFIDPKWQQSYASFNRLKIEPFIYRRYSRFEFILFYELDAWVFDDRLEFWCDQGFDFVGAPWFENYDLSRAEARFLGVGNGGFSLRKVKSHLRALHSFAFVRTPKIIAREFLDNISLEFFFKMIRNLTIGNNTFFLFNDYRFNEDHFWGRVVARKFKWFRVPAFDMAMKFSMELNAPLLYNKNHNKLPFGCHKWEKYHADFWKQFIVTTEHPHPAPVTHL